ncbi:MAG TPA: hypothetical protein VMV92_08815 [Streptosporangiaceae bacterium]|nr:hypothetical protein [Streptosporangiaceae bacterium]
MTGGGCLGGIALGFAEVGDGFDESGEAGQEHELGQDGIAAGERGPGHEPGGAAQVVTGRRWGGDSSVGHACGAVVGVGGLADGLVAQQLGRDVEGVGDAYECPHNATELLLGPAPSLWAELPAADLAALAPADIRALPPALD